MANGPKNQTTPKPASTEIEPAWAAGTGSVAPPFNPPLTWGGSATFPPPNAPNMPTGPNTPGLVVHYDGGPTEHRIKVMGNNTNIDPDDLIVLFDGFMIGSFPFPPSPDGSGTHFPPPGRPWPNEPALPPAYPPKVGT